MKFLIIDDAKLNYSSIAPLRSQLDVRAGILKLRQRLEGYLNIDEVHLIIDDKLEEIYKERYSDKIINELPAGEVCVINGRLKIDEEMAEFIFKQELNTLYLNDSDEFISLKFNNPTNKKMDSKSFFDLDLSAYVTEKKSFALWSSISELISANGELIEQDFQGFFYDKDNFCETEQGVTIINPYHVWIGEDVVLKQGTILDASSGAIIVDEGCEIGLNCTIEGPAYIGKNSVLNATTSLRGGVSIGKGCEIAGEIVSSVIQGYCTKPFGGTLNRCYVGEWTKFEAGVSLDSNFFEADGITIIRDYALSFLINNSSAGSVCQYQEMRRSKLEAMKFNKNVGFSKLEQTLLKKHLNEEINE